MCGWEHKTGCGWSMKCTQSSGENGGVDRRGLLTPRWNMGLFLLGVAGPVNSFEQGGEMVRFLFSVRHSGVMVDDWRWHSCGMVDDGFEGNKN